MVVHAYNPGILKAEAGGLQVRGLPGLCIKNLLQTNNFPATHGSRDYLSPHFIELEAEA
jgi:hypothetical protein